MKQNNWRPASGGRSFIRLIAIGALILPYAGLLPQTAFAFDAKDLERVLRGQDCPGCDLSGADLFARNLPNINLSGANLSRAKLSLTSLKGANLARANLKGTELASSFLFGADLSEANLSQAILDGAYLHQVNLQGAILIGADLNGAYLFDANLREADLKGAKLEATNLSGTNLTLAKLDQASFGETIYDSKTRFPSNFDTSRSSLTTKLPNSDTHEPPSRSSSRLAEIHQLAFARTVLTMGAADARAYGGSTDKTLKQAAAEVSQRLMKLTLETTSEEPL